MTKQNLLTLQSFIKSYWNYYIELEDHFCETQRYVDFDTKNNSAFSIEYLKLFQAICSEIDVVAKEMAKFNSAIFVIDNNTNIQKWGYEIQQLFSDISDTKVRVANDSILVPWSNWKYEKYKNKKGNNCIKLSGKAKTPSWWTAYNKAKHQRTSIVKGDRTYYTQANLKNVTFALSALYILETKFIDHVSTEKNNIEYKKSKLFRMYNEYD